MANALKDCAFILIGLLAIAVALLGKKFYHSDAYGNGSMPAPTWSGKWMFSIIGSILIAVAFLDLFGIIQLGRN